MHHDNAPDHTSMLAREFLSKNKTVIMLQPLYLPEFSLADLFLFLELKTSMKQEKPFATIEEIREKSKTRAVGDIKKLISEVFRRLYLKGFYFEGDKIVIDK